MATTSIKYFSSILTLILLLCLNACSNAEKTGELKATNVTPHTVLPDTPLEPALISDPENQTTGKNEQEVCTPLVKQKEFTQSDCEEDLICVPDIYKPQTGHCRVACDQDQCPQGRSCQKVTSLQLAPLGSFCLPKQTSRDEPCQAFFDKNACSNGRSCLATSFYMGKNKKVTAKQFLCRKTCPITEENADQSCADHEQCRESTVKKTGICGKNVKWASADDVSAGGICNEVSGHNFCDTTPLEGLQNPAITKCIPMSKNSPKGICFAMCSLPTLDHSQDGQINPNEAKTELSCPVGYECSPDLGRKLGLVQFIKDKNNPTQKKTCDTNICKPGSLCPSQCGPGDAECLEVSNSSGMKYGVCGAPFGSCEPK